MELEKLPKCWDGDDYCVTAVIYGKPYWTCFSISSCSPKGKISKKTVNYYFKKAKDRLCLLIDYDLEGRFNLGWGD